MNKKLDYSKFYNLENYLFRDVTKKFHDNGYIEALDFFCIIIWKANRAKSKIAKKLIEISKIDNLDNICKKLSSQINNSKLKEDKLRILLDNWKFRLPMASAILTVLYPDDFTVYDYRVCKILGKYQSLVNKIKIENMIKDYFRYIEDVNQEVKEKSLLRDKDRYLWGKSFYEDLKIDLKNKFKKSKES